MENSSFMKIYQYWLNNYCTINYTDIKVFAKDMEISVEEAYQLLDDCQKAQEEFYEGI